MGWREQIAKALLGKQAAPLAGKTGGVWEGGIRAYHSSPYDFDKVDFSKLRTGEGANVYGAGHYMAENPAVSGQGGQYWKQFSDRFPLDEASAAAALFDTGFDRTKAIEHARRLVGEAKPDTPIARQRLNALRLLEEGGPVGPRTYEMNLRAKPEELLDWNTPLPRQSAFIKDALDRIGIRKEMPNASGNAIYDALMNRGMLTEPVSKLQMRASETLADAGIPGIRYLDEGSRGRAISNKSALWQEPLTYNYVGTDPSKLDILAKYGIGGATAVPPTLGAFTAQDTYEARP